MMPVAVPPPPPLDLALELHPPHRAAIAGQGGGHLRRIEAQLGGDGKGGGGIPGVVPTGYGEVEPQGVSPVRELTSGPHPPWRNACQPLIPRCRLTPSHTPNRQ